MAIGTRIIKKDRKPLIDLLPLEAPLVLFVDPSDACNLACKFCPTSNLMLMQKVNRPLKTMDFSLFKKIVKDCEKFETKIKVLRLYSHGEPLINPNFCDMVKLAKLSNKFETVDTTTNGILLNKKLNEELISSGIDRINISVNGVSEEQYLDFCGRKVDFIKYVENIRHLYSIRKDTYIFIKTNGDTLTKEQEERFLAIFEPIADAVGIERSMGCWNDFKSEGFVKNSEGVDIYGEQISNEVKTCPYLFYSFSVHSNGKVSFCFLDWNYALAFDNAWNNSIYDIWNGKELRDFRLMMLNDKRKKHPVCKDCDQMIKGQPENIDKYSENLKVVYGKETDI